MSSDSPNEEDDFGAEEEYTAINQKIIDILEEEIEFERRFYKSVCDTDDFEVLLIPDEKGYIPTREEIMYIEANAFQNKVKLLYRVSHGKFATVYDPYTGKVGIMPENNGKGFAC